MNNGVANEATRCFRRIGDAFLARVRAANPGLETSFKHVQPRNLGELPDEDVDLVLSSGGPGSPFDGIDDPWATGYRKFLDRAIEKNRADPATGPSVFAVCHSFELAVIHFGVGTMRLRKGTKFGLMPAYLTADGQKNTVFEDFEDWLFAFEHRDWEAVDLNAQRLQELGGALLARESRPDRQDKGEALLSFAFGPGVVGTQFHPEADRPGVIAWITRPEKAKAFKETYGEVLYDRMMKSLSDPNRLARTFALLIPGWLTRRFNELAAVRGYRTVTKPENDMHQFEVAV